MTVRILAVAAIVTFCAALFVAMPRPSTPAEVSHETAVVVINFDALRAEAAAAYLGLRFEVRRTGYGELQPSLVEFVDMRTHA